MHNSGMFVRVHDWIRRSMAAAGFAAAVAVASGTVSAQGGGLVRTAKTPHVSATFAPALAVAAPGASVPVVLHQRILDGWHTYWENPGDSGERIAIEWTLPDGITASALRYPVPQAIPVGPLMNYGFSGEAAVLAELAIPADWPAGRPVPVKAHATWLVCEKICIPEEAQFELLIPTGAQTIPLEQAGDLFRRANAALPKRPPWQVTARDEGETLVLSFNAPIDSARFDHAYFFSRRWGHVNHAEKQITRAVNGGVELVLAKGELPTSGVLEGVLALDGKGNRGFAISVPVNATAGTATRIVKTDVPPPNIVEGYDADRLKAVLAGGGAVFVNVTADWCVICRINEQAALSGAAFRRALAEYDVTYMTGDWTERDPELTALLKRFGRAGVPLYVIFPRAGDAPRVLPQILTESIVIEAIGNS